MWTAEPAGSDRIRQMKFEPTAPTSKTTLLVYSVEKKNLSTLLELVSGGNVLIVHDVYLDSFSLIAG